jgi:hypothetical protein
MCSIGSGFSLEADTMECDSSISCSDQEDITFESEYEEEEFVEDEEEEEIETVVGASEHF